MAKTTKDPELLRWMQSLRQLEPNTNMVWQQPWKKKCDLDCCWVSDCGTLDGGCTGCSSVLGSHSVPAAQRFVCMECPLQSPKYQEPEDLALVVKSGGALASSPVFCSKCFDNKSILHLGIDGKKHHSQYVKITKDGVHSAVKRPTPDISLLAKVADVIDEKDLQVRKMVKEWECGICMDDFESRNDGSFPCSFMAPGCTGDHFKTDAGYCKDCCLNSVKHDARTNERFMYYNKSNGWPILCKSCVSYQKKAKLIGLILGERSKLKEVFEECRKKEAVDDGCIPLTEAKKILALYHFMDVLNDDDITPCLKQPGQINLPGFLQLLKVSHRKIHPQNYMRAAIKKM